MTDKRIEVCAAQRTTKTDDEIVTLLLHRLILASLSMSLPSFSHIFLRLVVIVVVLLVLSPRSVGTSLFVSPLPLLATITISEWVT